MLGPRPPELERLIERRRELGIDLFDEVWEGSYHVAPAPSAAHAYLDDVLAVLLHRYARAAGLIGTGPFNLGRPDDFRVPDRGLHRGRPRGTWVATAALVVEILSPDDETYEKFAFYASHEVDELLVADAAAKAVGLWRRAGDRYETVVSSELLEVTAAALTAAIDRPETD